MAKKSSKTTHVLNLLSGHDTKKEPENTQPQAAETPAVSIIDTTGEDPVAEQIQENLLHELEKETESVPETKPEPETEAVSETQAETVSEPPTEAVSDIQAVQQTETAPQAASVPQTQTVQQSEAASGTLAVTQTEAAAETQPEPEPEIITQTQAVQQTEAVSDMQSEPQPEPEPEFIHVNIMEEIVRDKIIYFMRQFDCCTCSRCVADAIALTLNGLMPKYIVTDPAAKDPLISFYTNRFIPDITVEATKACMIIKENPRHKQK